MFVPRTIFPEVVKTSWYPGHMNAALREIQQLLNTTDLLIEVRDARIPLSSRNPRFTSILAQRPRIIVYNKSDLTDLSKDDRRIIKSWESSSTVLFQDTKSGSSISNLLQSIRQRTSSALSIQGTRILVLGMPNVGKSSILNALRRVSLGKGKAAKTGAQPGITRSTNSIFKLFDDPTTYLIDSPGIMVPFIPDSQTMLKLGLVNCIKESIIDATVMADYLLFQLNLRASTQYVTLYKTEQSNDISSVLAGVAKRLGKIKKGGEFDLDASARTFIQDYRDGKLGKFCLDDIAADSFDVRVEEEGKYLSKSQIRRGMTVKEASKSSQM